jgi:hypothetical protein
LSNKHTTVGHRRASNALHQVHTRVHSLTCFTQNIVTDRGYIHTTAIKLYLLHYLYNTCFTQNIVTYSGYICITVFNSSCLYRAGTVSKHFLLFHNDAHNYKITGILKQLKSRRSLRHVSVHAGTIIREPFLCLAKTTVMVLYPRRL